ncbi:TPA: N-acetylgalactosamine-N,N'-diacetylbacillosaminyl-diphospho-undecaprenol 4-alpha-N-acetylgalactosaminyltransferase, partial [Campylobacter jejuni]|nr:N-acetylgalactosamine-N,N'-diacetylbacillosaminyl-diphospho-undecaprenol 4-alpha-N-acetylgalactosaminyltransferase [Campylobacter jejuni]
NLGIDTEFVFLNRPNYIALMARMFGNKTRLVINECTTPSVMYMKNNFNSLVNKFLISLLYPKADLILPNSKGNLEDLVQNFSISPKKCEILYNAIDLENIGQKALEDIALKDKFILSVG